MTDRLSTLLHDAASTLDPPSLSAGRAITEGRGLRQRRRARIAVAGTVVTALVAIGATAATGRLTGADHTISPAEQLSYEQRGAWAVGIEVHVGDHVVEIPDAPRDHRSVFVGPISYTSVGALVPYVDLSTAEGNEAPSTSVLLVTPNGDTTQLGQMRGWASDPDSSEIVYSRAASTTKGTELVALDLATGEERTVGASWDDNEAPQPARSGDMIVYVRDQHTVATDLGTGETRRLSDLPELGMTTMQSFGHGGYLTTPSKPGEPAQTWHLRGLPGGELIGTFPDAGDGHATMSPDGRYVMTSGNGEVTVYDVAAGKPSPLGLKGSVDDYGWTPDGHVVGAQGSNVMACDPTDGSCSDVGDLSGERLSVARGATGTEGTGG